MPGFRFLGLYTESYLPHSDKKIVKIISSFLGSPWIPLALLIALAAYARILRGSWLHPAAFPSLVWSAFILGSFVVAPEHEVSAFAVWVILGLILATYIGATLVERQMPGHEETTRAREVSLRRLLLCVLFFSSAAMAGVVLFTIISLSKYDLEPSFPGLLALGHLVSVDRYSGVQEPALVRALWPWIFPAALLGGVTFELAKNRMEKCLSLAAFAPGLVLGFVETTRAAVLVPVCCWLGSFFSMKVYVAGDKYRLFNRRTLFLATMLAIAMIFVFFGLDALRVFTPEKDFVAEADFARLKAYSVGSLSFFSNWIDRKESSAPIAFGGQTFRSFFELVGLKDRQFEEPLTFKDGGETNISTAFRGLIQDFTFPGAFFVCLAMGWAGGRAYGRIKQGNLTSEAALSAFYTLFLFSPVVSLTAYNGPILGWIVVYFILRWATKGQAVSIIAANVQTSDVR